MKYTETIRRSRQHCFTLLELLVVVAIILVLASMLFPATLKIQESAKRINCISKHKTIGALNLQYASRNNGLAATSGNLAYYAKGRNLYVDGVPAGKNVVISEGLGAWDKIMIDQGVFPVDLWEMAYQRWAGSMGGVWESEANWWFICDNTPLPWSGMMYNGAYTKAEIQLREKTSHVIMYARYSIGPRSFYTQRYKFTGASARFGRETCGYCGVPGEHACITSRGASSFTEDRLPMSSIPRPGARVYAAENGLASTRSYDFVYGGQDLTFPTGQINTSSGYIAGYGGGGAGKERIESMGYSGAVTQSRHAERVMEDVEEGRHNGVTLHLFFDGHVEAISAKKVGESQLDDGGSAPESNNLATKKTLNDEYYSADNKPLKGLYASPSWAGE